MNCYAIGGNDSYGYTGYTNYRQIAQPSRQLLFTDSHWSSTDFTNGNYAVAGDANGLTYVDFRHVGNTNVTYADGHVQGSPFSALSIGSWYATAPWGWPQ